MFAVFIAVNICRNRLNTNKIQEDVIAKAIQISENLDNTNYLFYNEENLDLVHTKYTTNFDKETLLEFATISVGNYDGSVANDFIDIINNSSELGDLIVDAVNKKVSKGGMRVTRGMTAAASSLLLQRGLAQAAVITINIAIDVIVAAVKA